MPNLNEYLIVDNDLRTISIPESVKHLGVEYDDGVYSLGFQIPSTYHDVDLKNYDIQINYVNADGKGDVYHVPTKTVSGAYIMFKWIIGRFAFVKKGNVLFNVCLKNVIDGIITNEFNTMPVQLPVLGGLETDEKIIQENPDILEQWKRELFGYFTGSVDETLTEKGQAADSFTAGSRIGNISAGLLNAATKAELRVERQRIDDMIAGKETVGTDAEFNDLRIDVHGDTHATVGGAVRSQVNAVSIDVAHQEDNIFKMFTNGNMFVYPRWVNGGIDGATGEETTASGRFRTADFISFKQNTIDIVIPDNCRLIWYGYSYENGEYVIKENASSESSNEISINMSYAYRFVAMSLGATDTLTEAELAEFAIGYIPDVIYATKTDVADDVVMLSKTIDGVSMSFNNAITSGYLTDNSPWVVGGINGSTGAETTATDRIKTTDYFKPVSNRIYYDIAEGYRLLIFKYTYNEVTSEYEYVACAGYYTGSSYYEVEDNIYCRFLLRGVEDFEFTGDEYVNVSIKSPVIAYVRREEIDGLIGNDIIPAYWETTLSEKEAAIKNIVIEATKAGNDISMFFATADPHYPQNNMMSNILANYLSEKCGINLAVCLGDLIADSIVSHEEGLGHIQLAMKSIAGFADRMIFTQGNHDDNAGIANNDGQILAERIVYDTEWIHHTSSKIAGLKNLVFDEKCKAYYYDDDIQKIRFIAIDSFENKTYTIVDGVMTSANLGQPSDRQLNWIRDVALQNVPSGYVVISFSHLAPFGPYVNNGTEYVTVPHGYFGNAAKMLEVFNAFKNDGGVYVGHFAGHLHHDFLSTKDGVTSVHLLNDGTHWRGAEYFGTGFEFVGDAPTKTAGTITECAFDVVIINRTTKHVDLVRIGAGDNREFDY